MISYAFLERIFKCQRTREGGWPNNFWESIDFHSQKEIRPGIAAPAGIQVSRPCDPGLLTLTMRFVLSMYTTSRIASRSLFSCSSKSTRHVSVPIEIWALKKESSRCNCTMYNRCTMFLLCSYHIKCNN